LQTGTVFGPPFPEPVFLTPVKNFSYLPNNLPEAPQSQPTSDISPNSRPPCPLAPVFRTSPDSGNCRQTKAPKVWRLPTGPLLKTDISRTSHRSLNFFSLLRSLFVAPPFFPLSSPLQSWRPFTFLFDLNQSPLCFPSENIWCSSGVIYANTPVRISPRVFPPQDTTGYAS